MGQTVSEIFHITTRDGWEAALNNGSYAPRSLEQERFIHCSRRWQLADVANARYAGQQNLVVLCIDTDRVLPEIRSEDCFNTGERYPHIYGPLDPGAVTKVVGLSLNADGLFSVPGGL